MRVLQTTFRFFLLAILGVVLAWAVHAQDAAAPGPASSSEPEVEKPEEKVSPPSAAASEAPRERFAPSEDLPVGDSVAFPVDI